MRHYRLTIKLALGAVALVITLVALAVRFIDVALDVDGSSWWISSSTADAAKRGILVAHPRLVDSTFLYRSGAYRVADLWIEHTTHREAPWLFWASTIVDSAYRVVAIVQRTDPARTPAFIDIPFGGRGRPGLALNDSIYFDRSTGAGQWIAPIRPPFPSAARLSVRQP